MHPFREKILFRLDTVGCLGDQEVRQLVTDQSRNAVLAKYANRPAVDGGECGTLYHMHLNAIMACTMATRLQASSSSADLSTFDIEMSWLHGLPAAESPTLHHGWSGATHVNPRPLVAELLGRLGRHAEALVWATAGESGGEVASASSLWLTHARPFSAQSFHAR